MSTRRRSRVYPLHLEAVEARIAPSGMANPGVEVPSQQQKDTTDVVFAGDQGEYAGPARVRINPHGYVSGKFESDTVPPSGTLGYLYFTDDQGDHVAQVRTTPSGAFQGYLIS